ncbi:MAG TPA: TrkA C-terminal domain-containing protein [Actinomycetota bacterium]|nr:TrkA C-terminal domain-containing protein [Actinomycetota bacterium]
MLSVITVLVVVVVSILVTRLATVALTVTGLSREMARFQARSALSGVGFTTSEAEEVVNHPVRRRIVMLLMVISQAGLVTILATTMLSFVGSRSARDATLRAAILLGGLLAILIVARLPWVDRGLSRLAARVLSRFTDLEIRDYARLLQLTRDYGVSELQVEPQDWLADRTLAELRLADEGVLVLGIEQPGGEFLGTPRGDTVLHAEDVLVLYGRTSALAELDRRRRGTEGDQAHRQAVARQERIEQREHPDE